ncbi:dTMP kinase [Alkalihalobacillus pseudalcaliphilus]|uniref:dTMP kinase n=1 Tax=Alkalihalobacillus pseudalcaliphilus TaxID=79884 RepID=UPI00064DF439|nr:dTMP kinase [Alkalihalobacillus pseudalcaliphilus]KMK74462.1 thymidylate kinase [Alkalihalobacillus pseudalcaliphilus]
MLNGWFITVEGGEGAGKTTIVDKVEHFFKDHGFDVMRTREPGGIKIAEKIREVILDVTHTEMDERTEALLYAAARRQHLIEKVLPALKEGKIVICDRFIDSSLAYQGIARGIGLEEVLAINEFAIEGCYPGLTLYFDVDPKVGLARISSDSEREVNRLDKEKLDFHEKVKDGYDKVNHMYPERIQVINANHSIEDVFQQVMHAITMHDQYKRLKEMNEQ